MDLNVILSNPTRFRIIQHLSLEGDSTTKQIADALEDVPAPTIYRHINYLLKEGILTVKEERKVRGTAERLLSLDAERWSKEVNGDISATAFQFLMDIHGRFQRYLEKEDADPVADRLCMRTAMLRLTDERFDGFLSEYAELLKRYSDADERGKIRSVSIISSPVEEEEQ